MKRLIPAIGRGILMGAAILGMLALAAFALGVVCVSYPYKRASKNSFFAAFLDMTTAAGVFFGASGTVLQTMKKQPETAQPETSHSETETGRMEETPSS